MNFNDGTIFIIFVGQDCLFRKIFGKAVKNRLGVDEKGEVWYRNVNK
jgi:hypothetical protein